MDDDELDAFFEMMERSICGDFVEYMEFLDGIGCYIPFVTTVNYLTHPSSRKAFDIVDYTKLKN